MRLAFSISGARTAGAAVRAAREAEAAGCDTVWITEDYCERGAFALAGAIAAATSRVRIGIGVINPWTRHPALIAMELAALEEISEGRAVLGLGASNPRWMTDQLGIPFDRPIGRLTESVDVIRALMTGEPVHHEGEHFRVDARLAFTPPRIRPPIVLGVKGPRALAMAAGRADGLLLSILSSAPYIASVREHVGPKVELAAYVGLCVDDGNPAAARDRARPGVATYLGVHGDHEITRIPGLDPDRCAAFREGWRSGTPRTDLVDDALLDLFTAAGHRSDAARHLSGLAAAGLDVAVIRDDLETDPGFLLEIAAGLLPRAS
ncbi:LLM class flavin-dependent oxidoreductase [Spongiactinospora sp. TRM90649]|uniref:LLM class flavin-dependent oxidoreductase n=1 Tax=Spongiactinospora sp. TRM90649 TaxID=3031114 RepID=UPI0023F8EC52|nr:LLM class flavin-dependent oxidoreductase [Spongiactinospora sp. TRM90649]MDF5756031.1 LLM class flavin-dependent oxidoreductase [Spongiactinospora sp. TRM90649]